MLSRALALVRNWFNFLYGHFESLSWLGIRRTRTIPHEVQIILEAQLGRRIKMLLFTLINAEPAYTAHANVMFPIIDS
jgi:hypothetical protein